MSFCAKCGARLEEATRFCSKCGTATRVGVADVADSIADAAKTVGRELELAFKTAGEEIEKALGGARDDLSQQGGPFCPNCGKRNPRDAEFCFACGRGLPSVT